MEKISCAGLVKNEEVLRGVKEENNIRHRIRLNELFTSRVGTAF